jgi:phosphatidate cytidylyltransferase
MIALLSRKSIEKQNCSNVYPKENYRRFYGGVVFCVVASYLISKYYIEIAVRCLFGLLLP